MNRTLISCDWGTTYLRLREINLADGAIQRQIHVDQGVARIAAGLEPADNAARFAATLEEHLAAWFPHTERDARPSVLISGMASSSIGWRELPYARLPFSLAGEGIECHALEASCPELVHQPTLLISGARSETDVMRGEETELLGLGSLLREHLLAECVVLLTGDRKSVV